MKRLLLVMLLLMAGCTLEETQFNEPNNPASGDTGRVVNVVDGDTIDVEIDGETFRVRYVGVNTPERDEVCYAEATQANNNLVAGQTVRLERDVSDTDRYDRLLRYVYVGDTFVNAVLVHDGWAEVVVYDPDNREFENFRTLEIEAARDQRGCHPTGIFNDNSYAR